MHTIKSFLNHIDYKINRYTTHELNMYLSKSKSWDIRNRNGFILVKFAKDMLNINSNEISFVRVKDSRTGYGRSTIITYSQDDILKIKEFI